MSIFTLKKCLSIFVLGLCVSSVIHAQYVELDGSQFTEGGQRIKANLVVDTFFDAGRSNYFGTNTYPILWVNDHDDQVALYGSNSGAHSLILWGMPQIDYNGIGVVGGTVGEEKKYLDLWAYDAQTNGVPIGYVGTNDSGLLALHVLVAEEQGTSSRFSYRDSSKDNSIDAISVVNSIEVTRKPLDTADGSDELSAREAVMDTAGTRFELKPSTLETYLPYAVDLYENENPLFEQDENVKHYSVDQTALIPVLLQAVKDQQVEIDTQPAAIDAQQAEIDLLRIGKPAYAG